MNRLKFKTFAEITDFSSYNLTQFINLLAFGLGTLSLLLGNLILIPFVLVVGLELSLAKYLMEPSDVQTLHVIRLGVIIITGLLTLLF